MIFSFLTISKLQLENKLFKYDEGKKLFLKGEKSKKNILKILIKSSKSYFSIKMIIFASSLMIFDKFKRFNVGFD